MSIIENINKVEKRFLVKAGLIISRGVLLFVKKSFPFGNLKNTLQVLMFAGDGRRH